MRALILSVYLVTVVWLAPASAKPVELALYSTDSPPIWSPNLPKMGLGAEILDAVAQEANLSIKIDYLPLKRYEHLTTGNRVGNPSYFIGQEFASVIPLLMTQAGFCYYQPHQPQGNHFHSLMDLNGLTLGVIRGTVADKDEFLNYGVKVEENATLEALFSKLKQKRIDVALVIDTTAYYYINQLFPNEIDNFRFNPLANGETPIAIMLDKNTLDAKELTVKINQALQKIIADGRYYQIIARYNYGKETIPSDWNQRLAQAINQYRASPIIIHE